MKGKKKTALFLASLIVVIIFSLILNLPKIGASPGIPQGICSAKSLLLDANFFPSDTTVWSSENFEDVASDTASNTFRNPIGGFDAYHAIEYHNSPFSAWLAYQYYNGIFKKDKYNDGWKTPSEVTFSSQTVDQYHFACTNDTILGHMCIFHARYGRYFVLFSANLSQEFTTQNLSPLLKEIDTRLSNCLYK